MFSHLIPSSIFSALRAAGIASCAFALLGCQNTVAPTKKTTKEVVVTEQKSAEVVEPLKELSRSTKGVTVRVYTGGCTEKAHFVWKKTTGQPKGAPTELILYRNTKDNCYANIPEGMVIEYSYAELGVEAKEEFTIGNPLQMPGVDPDA